MKDTFDIFLYNTLTKQKELFTPVKKGHVSIYACGPTVYWYAHVGNMRTNIFVDVLKRTLSYNGLDVTLIMNITDVGHLTDDADDGEDKMIVAMKREGKTAYDIAEFYEKEFYKDLERLNILQAQKYPKATGHIPEQIAMVQELEKNGYTYVTGDGVYFDSSKLKDYGKLSGQKIEDKKAGARVAMGDKKNASDFALWKFSPKESKREMEWESPWGTGFPGWAIECSAMSQKYLGVPFDIHTGGVDHIPVHHENELAQTQGAENKLQANVWIHGDFLTVDNGKMSKSLGNLYTVDQLIEKGYDPLVFRYFTFSAHYRTKLNFTFEALDSAQNALNRLYSTINRWPKPGKKGAEKYEDRFLQAVNNDLDLPNAVAVIWEMVHDKEVKQEEKSTSINKFDKILGLDLDKHIGIETNIPKEIIDLAKQRDVARNEKNFKLSDDLRAQIEDKGFMVEDTQEGFEVYKK
ncbi:MAG: cysteine--tRNA ligase [Patescibacteria group bacterium]